MARFANVIVDISTDKLDKTFQYRIPDELEKEVFPGVQVEVTFGNRALTGYVVEVTDEPEYDVSKIKPLTALKRGSVEIESQLIALAGWMRRNYGATMNQALKTVLPVRRKKKPLVHRRIALALPKAQAVRQLALYEQKHNTARARLLRELVEQESIDYGIVVHKLNISAAVIRAMREKGVLTVEESTAYRNPIGHLDGGGYHILLNEQQRRVTDAITRDMEHGDFGTYLLKGVTGSGKTEVYMELIAHTVAAGRQAIVLIPEIALTYQTAKRFYNRFGDRVSILNSRLSDSERYDQYMRAKNGNIDIMIGPRSALFAPFSNLGIIIIDEEHENSYKSETSPRYHARETAIERARMCGASVVLGSATPSVESYYHAKSGRYRLLEMAQRVSRHPLPECEIVDLRRELRSGNRSILSMRLQELMEDRLEKGEQVMLFLNRRGVSGFVSCRSCGHVVKCPHCDVSLSVHNGGRMVCHYCGYSEPEPQVCPSCGSRYIAGFKAGTQKVEQLVRERFPQARVLRMDFDTTRKKDSYEVILQRFANNEADILIGTQMIVKGHDFENVTLMGILAADMSLNVGDYHAAERTFQLVTQAAGRAGRGEVPGRVVIQTYRPEHFAVTAAGRQDYDAFYEQEIEYRKLLSYPPVKNMLVILATSPNKEALDGAAKLLEGKLRGMQQFGGACAGDCGGPSGDAYAGDCGANRDSCGPRGDAYAGDCGANRDSCGPRVDTLQIMGPADASIARISDIYRKVVYLKAADYGALVAVKDELERFTAEHAGFRNVSVQYDFNPMSGF